MNERPLLLANKIPYKGPWVPLRGVEFIKAEGLIQGLDEIKVTLRDLDEVADDQFFMISFDMEIALKSKADRVLIRAERTRSSGKEVFVWVS